MKMEGDNFVVTIDEQYVFIVSFEHYPNRKIQFGKHKRSATVCRISYQGNQVAEGYSFVNPTDAYNSIYGRGISMMRALENVKWLNENSNVFWKNWYRHYGNDDYRSFSNFYEKTYGEQQRT